MVGKPSTHRLDPAVQVALDHLSVLLRRPKNRLINEAVKLYVEQKSHEVERQLEGTLKALRAYRGQDPDFERSIEAFADAETQLAGTDPAEGGEAKRVKGPRRGQIRRKSHAA